MTNIPPSVHKLVESYNLSPKEKEEVIKDLENQYINRKVRDQKHKENLKTNEDYNYWWNRLNGN